MIVLSGVASLASSLGAEMVAPKMGYFVARLQNERAHGDYPNRAFRDSRGFPRPSVVGKRFDKIDEANKYQDQLSQRGFASIVIKVSADGSLSCVNAVRAKTPIGSKADSVKDSEDVMAERIRARHTYFPPPLPAAYGVAIKARDRAVPAVAPRVVSPPTPSLEPSQEESTQQSSDQRPNRNMNVRVELDRRRRDRDALLHDLRTRFGRSGFDASRRGRNDSELSGASMGKPFMLTHLRTDRFKPGHPGEFAHRLPLPEHFRDEGRVQPGLVNIKDSQAEAARRTFGPFPEIKRNDLPFYQRDFGLSFGRRDLPEKSPYFRGRQYDQGLVRNIPSGGGQVPMHQDIPADPRNPEIFLRARGVTPFFRRAR